MIYQEPNKNDLEYYYYTQLNQNDCHQNVINSLSIHSQSYSFLFIPLYCPLLFHFLINIFKKHFLNVLKLANSFILLALNRHLIIHCLSYNQFFSLLWIFFLNQTYHHFKLLPNFKTILFKFHLILLIFFDFILLF